jgi:hypothetical protein
MNTLANELGKQVVDVLQFNLACPAGDSGQVRLLQVICQSDALCSQGSNDGFTLLWVELQNIAPESKYS